MATVAPISAVLPVLTVPLTVVEPVPPLDEEEDPPEEELLLEEELPPEEEELLLEEELAPDELDDEEDPPDEDPPDEELPPPPPPQADKVKLVSNANEGKIALLRIVTIIDSVTLGAVPEWVAALSTRRKSFFASPVETADTFTIGFYIS